MKKNLKIKFKNQIQKSNWRIKLERYISFSIQYSIHLLTFLFDKQRYRMIEKLVVDCNYSKRRDKSPRNRLKSVPIRVENQYLEIAHRRKLLSEDLRSRHCHRRRCWFGHAKSHRVPRDPVDSRSDAPLASEENGNHNFQLFLNSTTGPTLFHHPDKIVFYFRQLSFHVLFEFFFFFVFFFHSTWMIQEELCFSPHLLISKYLYIR